MSEHRARATKHFPGVPDGEIYPKHHVAGDIVVGDLAKVAIEEGWAERISDDEPDKASASPPVVVAAASTDGAGTEGSDQVVQGMTMASINPGAGTATDGAASTIEIPDDWKSMKWFALKALAEKVAGREVKDSDDAKAVVEAEVTRRSAS